MNLRFSKLIGAALMGGFGLWTAAMPAYGSTIGLGENVTVSATPVASVPGSISNASVTYSSIPGIIGSTAGISTTSNDPNSVTTYSPNPALATGGLLSGMIGLTDETGAANASASLTSGATHISASSAVENQSGTIPGSTTFVEVLMEDQLTFVVTGAASANVTLGYALDGNVSLNNTGTYSAVIEYFIGSADMDWTAATGAGGGVGTGETSGFNSFTYTNDTISGFQFQGSFTVTNGESLALFYEQTMNCSEGAVCNFANTGQMSLITPSNVTFSSPGGFLTQQGSSSTPEPGSLLLMGLGMATIICVGRRRLTR